MPHTNLRTMVEVLQLHALWDIIHSEACYAKLPPSDIGHLALSIYALPAILEIAGEVPS